MNNVCQNITISKKLHFSYVTIFYKKELIMTSTKFLQLIEILGGKDNLHQNIIEAEKNSEIIKKK